MDLAMRIQEKVVYLDSRKQQLVLDIIESYLFVEDDEDEETIAQDLRNIEIAEKGLLNGEATQRKRKVLTSS
ncbi:MAG: hypothetical protein FWE34_05565 [Defluviitaleaceae bacterium]|nr:hypothetical protein [Defluviitaleaceae bacterium]